MRKHKLRGLNPSRISRTSCAPQNGKGFQEIECFLTTLRLDVSINIQGHVSIQFHSLYQAHKGKQLQPLPVRHVLCEQLYEH